jgi:CelD/BcsL family acetyltransferase involved in cellulose biosynthesis
MTETSVLAPEFTSEESKRAGPLESDGRIFEIDPLEDPRWTGFIDGRADASIFHRPEWLRALKSCYGYEPRVLTSTPLGEDLSNGLAYCEVRSPLTGKRIVSLPFSDHCEPLVGSVEEYRYFLRNLMHRVDWGAHKYVEVRPIEFIPQSAGNFSVSGTYYLHRLDLARSEERLFRSFHKDSVQRRIRRAEREALRYEEGSSDLLLQQFYKLLIMTRRRQGVPPQPLKWFRTLISSVGSSLKIRIVRHGDTPVASIVTISDRKKMVYKYGCSDPHFNNLGGTPLLFWRAIRDAKAAGMEEFDLGRSDVNNTGLVTFKEHWGAQRIELNYWRYPFQAAGLSPENAIKHVRPLISILPDTALVMVGRLLYPHIG